LEKVKDYSKLLLILSLKVKIPRKSDSVMAFNATFNNISFISCQSALLVEETRVLGENHRTATTDLPEVFDMRHQKIKKIDDLRRIF